LRFLLVEDYRLKNGKVAVQLECGGRSSSERQRIFGGVDKSCKNGVDSMDKIRFEIIRLTTEQTREQIRLNHFSEDHKLTLKDRFSGADLEAEDLVRFPRVPGGPLLLSIFYNKGGDDFPTSISFYLERNEALSRQAERDCRFEGRRKGKKMGPSFLWADEVPLVGGLVMTSVLAGDYNADGRADYLVRLSDGGGILLQQAGDKALTECHKWIPKKMP
jgi:hypothetical protein